MYRHGYGAVGSAKAMSVVICSAAGESPRPGVDIDEFVPPSFLVDHSRQPPSILKAFARELEMSSDMAERPLFLLGQTSTAYG